MLVGFSRHNRNCILLVLTSDLSPTLRSIGALAARWLRRWPVTIFTGLDGLG